jgi:transcription antitermination factor NusG
MRAAAELRAQGYLVYLPKIHYRHQDGRKIEARTTLRFTGYIFIQFDADLEEGGPISNTRGMDSSDGSAILGGNKPVPIKAGIIEVLRQIEDEEYTRAVARKKPRPRTDLTPGDWVEINDPNDAFHGKRGTYLGSVKTRATVLLGIAVKEIEEFNLKKVEQERKRAA